MFIENFITYLYRNINLLGYRDRSIIISFNGMVTTSTPMTEKQGTLAIKICKKYKSLLDRYFNKDIDENLESPKWLVPLKKSMINKVVEIDEINNEKLIKVSFPYDEKIIAVVRQYRENFFRARWDASNKSWNFPFTETSILWIMENISPLGFSIDDEILAIYDKILEIISDVEKYVPMVAWENDRFVYKNVHESIKQPSSLNLLEVLFEAKKFGISIWDDHIETQLKNMNLSCITENFFKNIDNDKRNISIDLFNDIIKYAQPCLIIIPGIDQLKHITKWVNYLKNHGFSTDDMSVLFRLDNTANSEFNHYVKNEKLNNTINDNTKFVFISQRIPKPMIKSKVKFNSIVVIGQYYGIHHTQRLITEDNPNVILFQDIV